MHAQLITTALVLAGSAFAAGKSSSISSTSTVTLFDLNSTVSTSSAEHTSACTVCPKDYDRNWHSDSVLNDTRKHHTGFRLFANAKGVPVDFPLHVLSHKDSREDMWQLKFGNPINFTANSDSDQPKWNLHDNSLQTDGSAPVNKTLYFRLYNGNYPKDTENWIGPVFRTIATTIKNKKNYKKENADLIARKGWSLERDNDDPLSYVLKGSHPAGNFFACRGLDADEKDVQPLETDSDEMPDADDFARIYKLASSIDLVYSTLGPKEEFITPGNGLVAQKGCTPVTIKVCCRTAVMIRVPSTTDTCHAGSRLGLPQVSPRPVCPEFLASPLCWLNVFALLFFCSLFLPTMILDISAGHMHRRC